MQGKLAGTAMVAFLIAAGAKAQPDGATDRDLRLFPPRSAYEKVNMPKLEKYFASSLDYQIEGIIESALANVVLVHIAQPEYSSEVLKEKITNLSLTAESPSIRRKAYLAALVMGAPALFVHDADIPFTTNDELFRAFATRVQKTLQATQ